MQFVKGKHLLSIPNSTLKKNDRNTLPPLIDLMDLGQVLQFSTTSILGQIIPSGRELSCA